MFVPENVLLPEKVFEFARSVVEATVMLDAPVKVTPLMVAPGESAEAVPAFPPMFERCCPCLSTRYGAAPSAARKIAERARVR